MSRLRYALIGCGRRSPAHIEAVSALPELHGVVAVCDAHAESAERAAARLGVKAYTNVAEMVAREKLDVCDVGVPNELHHAVSCYLSAHGIHHTVETPLAPTVGLMDSMIETARKHGVILQTSENFPFLPAEQFTVMLIRSGVIGKVHRCYRLFSVIWYHGLAAIRCRMGARPVAVSSIAHTMPVVPYVDAARRDWRSESLEFYVVDFEGGGLAIAMVGNKNNCLGRNWLIGFEAVGERGTIITNGNQGVTGGETVNVCTDEEIALANTMARTYEFRREYTPAGTLQRIWVDLPSSLGGALAWVNPYRQRQLSEVNISVAALLEAFGRAVMGDGEPAWPAAEGRLDRELMIAAERSVKANRQPVALPLTIDPAEETAFDQDFVERFGIHPREDVEKVLGVSFKAR